jgi:hypothetical protein
MVENNLEKLYPNAELLKDAKEISSNYYRLQLVRLRLIELFNSKEEEPGIFLKISKGEFSRLTDCLIEIIDVVKDIEVKRRSDEIMEEKVYKSLKENKK